MNHLVCEYVVLSLIWLTQIWGKKLRPQQKDFFIQTLVGNKTGAYNRNGEKFFDKSILVSILSEIIKQLQFWSFLTSFGIVRILLCESICKLLIVIPIGLNNPE